MNTITSNKLNTIFCLHEIDGDLGDTITLFHSDGTIENCEIVKWIKAQALIRGLSHI